MKTLKKILVGQSMSDVEMSLLQGKGGSNINNGSGCSCQGSDDGHAWCNDNSNQASGCECTGNGNNSNTQYYCSCG